ncbi:uncharacterized protein LOC135503167 isoform X2 [Lineus longissimus]|uniref:uncharacterized protein LOC135503167 isoform X2 n=1 Tax=Lineus longissimus TaxID=88925 RepID=UPI002B4D5BC1
MYSAASKTSSVKCYTTGADQVLNVTCSATQHILIHSSETQSATDCATDKPGTKWNSGQNHLIFSSCNMRKEKCQTGSISSTMFMRINYTCVDDLSSLQRYNICADVTSGYLATPIYMSSPGYPAEHNLTKENCSCHLSVHPNVTKPSKFSIIEHDILVRFSYEMIFNMYNDVYAPIHPRGDFKSVSSQFNATGGAFVKYGVINFNNLGVPTTKAIYATFHPLNSGSGYFWMSLESEGDELWTIRCNNAARPTRPPTTPSQPTTTPTVKMANPEPENRWYADPVVYWPIVVAVIVVAAIIIATVVVVMKRRKQTPDGNAHMRMKGQSDGHTNPAA